MAVLPGLALIAYNASEQLQEVTHEAQLDALRVAQLVSADHQRRIRETRLLLTVLSQIPAVIMHDAQACAALFSNLVQHPLYDNFGALDPSGRAWCSGNPLPPNIDASDRSYFQRAMQTRAFSMGEYQISRVTGKPVLVAALPLLDDLGSVRSILIAALDLRRINELGMAAELPPNSSVTVADRKGTIFMRHPEPDRWVGHQVPEALVVRKAAAQSYGTTQTRGVDGVNRLFAYARLGEDPQVADAFVYVGIPTDFAYAEVNRNLVRGLSALGLVLILAIGGTWLVGHRSILRPVESLVKATKRLAAGDLSARTGLRYTSDELGQLAHAYDKMAAALERRSKERELAEVRVRKEAERAQALANTAGQLNAQLDLKTVLQVVCEEAARAVGAPAATVALCEPATDTLVLAHCYGLPGEYEREHKPTPRAIYDEYARRAGPTIVLDAQTIDDLPNRELYSRHGVHTIAGVSLLRQNELLGTLNIYSLGQPRSFSDDELNLLRGFADQAALAIANARLFETAQRRLRELQALHTIDSAISGSIDLKLMLNVLLEQVTETLRVDAADVLLVDPHVHMLEYAAGRGFRSHGIEHSRLRLGEGYAGRVALERRISHIANLAQADDFVRRPLLAEEGFVAYFGVPLVAKGQVKGVLEIFHRAALSSDQDWLDLLAGLASQAAIAIDNAQLFENVQRANLELVSAYEITLEGWSRALDLRDKETEGHTRRVTEMTLRLAHELGVPDAELAHIRRGALLHDIGKMGVPDSILLKPGPLSEEEWEMMRQHPVYAYELLSPIPYLRLALDIPYCHHEKWDGTGYPRGLKGEQIPLAARIFAVADAYDAMTSDRPYRKAKSQEEALAELRRGSGTQFDPDVVAAFLRLLRMA